VITPFVWREVTRNCHVARPDGSSIDVVTLERPEKRRPNGKRHDWTIIVLGVRHSWDRTFCQYDPQDLESTKSAAEARTRWAVRCLYHLMRLDSEA
jgi:hypothetical protein